MESVKDTILTIKQAAQRSRVHRSRIDAAIAGRELKFMKLRSAFWNGELGLVVLGPRANRLLLSELERWWRAKATELR